jgi:hypothetical protein
VGPALGVGRHRVSVDLRLMDKAAFGASQCPVFETGTSRVNVLDFRARLAFGTTGPRWHVQRQRGHLWLGHVAPPLRPAGALLNSLSPETAEGGSVMPYSAVCGG